MSYDLYGTVKLTSLGQNLSIFEKFRRKESVELLHSKWNKPFQKKSHQFGDIFKNFSHYSL